MLRALCSAFAVLIAGFFAFEGFAGLNAYRETSDLWRVAGLIESGQSPPIDLLNRLSTGPAFEKAAASCRDDLSRASVTIRLRQLDHALMLVRHETERQLKLEKPQQPGRAAPVAPLGIPAPDLVKSLSRLSRKDSLDAAVAIREDVPDAAIIAALARKADDAVRQRLGCAPADGNAWLHHAMLMSLNGGAAEPIDAALRLSYWAAPSEKWVIDTRARFVAGRVDAGNEALLAELSSDLWRMIAFYPVVDIAGFYVEAGPRSRALMVPLVRKENERRRRAIIEEIDKLGASFR